MGNGTHSISKTSFLKFEQCQKAFFLYKNHPYLRDKISIEKQLTFKRGHDVGAFAQKLFPGGIDVSKETRNVLEAVEKTRELIQAKAPVIYEAAFIFNDVLVMVDILTFSNGSHTAYEVKSSLKVSEVYIKDACLQYYVLRNSLPDLSDFYLVTLNGDYILKGEIEPLKLFKKRSIRLRAEENLAYFEHQISSARTLLEQNAIPNIGVGKQCFRPYQCDFFGSCWKDKVSEDSIFQLPFIDRGKLLEWHDAGFTSIGQLDDTVLEKEKHKLLREAFIYGKPIVNKEKIAQLLSRVQQPAAAMDMEIWNPALPQVQGTGPFEQIPFLVSFYDGDRFYSKFIDDPETQAEDFACALIEHSSAFRTILVYDKTLEQSMISRLSAKYPRLAAELTALRNKLVDIGEIFLDLSYYDPSFKSNLSLKTVSAALLSEGTYSGIGSGFEAMGVYEQYRSADSEIIRNELIEALISYCNTDCLMTYRLYLFLQDFLQQKSP